MSDLGSDSAAGIELIIEQYHELHKLNPQHKLLQYITDITSEGFKYVKEKYQEFLDAFETPEDKKLDYIKRAKVEAAYFVALENACNELKIIS